MTCARRRRRAARRAASSSNGPTSDPRPVSRLSPGQVEITDGGVPGPHLLLGGGDAVDRRPRKMHTSPASQASPKELRN